MLPCHIVWSNPWVVLARPAQVAFSAWSPADCHHELGRRATCAFVERRPHSNTAKKLLFALSRFLEPRRVHDSPPLARLLAVELEMVRTAPDEAYCLGKVLDGRNAPHVTQCYAVLSLLQWMPCGCDATMRRESLDCRTYLL